MTTIGVRELRQHASKYLALVEAGEEIEVTNHGRAVARIIPISPQARTRQAMIDAGLLIPAKNPGGIADIVVADLPHENLSALIDREDRL